MLRVWLSKKMFSPNTEELCCICRLVVLFKRSCLPGEDICLSERAWGGGEVWGTGRGRRSGEQNTRRRNNGRGVIRRGESVHQHPIPSEEQLTQCPAYKTCFKNAHHSPLGLPPTHPHPHFICGKKGLNIWALEKGGTDFSVYIIHVEFLTFFYMYQEVPALKQKYVNC